MEAKVISLHGHKLKIVEKIIKKEFEKSDDEFGFVDEEYLVEHAKSGNVSIESLLQTVWMLVESMDRIEKNVLQFKLDILGLLNEAREDEKMGGD